MKEKGYERDTGGGGGNSVYGRGGDARRLVVSLRGVNFGVWSRFGCSWQNTIIFSCKGLL